MNPHSEWLAHYQRIREVRFRLNNLIVKTIPKATLDTCGQILGILQKGVLVFDSEEELSVLMDYCLYYPQRNGRNLVAAYLEKSAPPEGSDERLVLEAMTHAYYSLFQVVDVDRGIGVSVEDLLRNESHFITDVGLGATGQRHMILATRVIPMNGYLATGGAALPVLGTAAKRIVDELRRSGFHPETFDFHAITPEQEAELAAIVIRGCRASGMSSRVSYAEPGASPRSLTSAAKPRRIGRNDPCSCGSGKKFKMCCGRHLA